MRTNRERLIETLGDMVLEIQADRRLYSETVSEYADRIMDDINSGIIQAVPPPRACMQVMRTRNFTYVCVMRGAHQMHASTGGVVWSNT